MNSGKVNVRIIRTTYADGIPLCRCTCEVYIGQRGATTERIIANACDAVWNGDAFQRGATTERKPTNICDATQNSDARQRCAMLKRTVRNSQCTRFDSVRPTEGIFSFY